MISVGVKGNFNKVDSFFERLKEIAKLGILNEYGRKGVELLSEATPKDSGKTASSWNYNINRENGETKLEWHNDNMNDGVNIAIILQYGHATGTGGYVQGIDYINPALEPVFEDLLKELGKELEKV